MRDRIQTIAAKWLELKEQFGFILSPLGFAFKYVVTFIAACLVLHDFDLTGFSSPYLSKTFLILGLVSLGVYLFLNTRNQLAQILSQYAQLESWQIWGTLLVFFPLMILGGQREMLHWMTPILSSIILFTWSKRTQLRHLKFQRPTAVNYYQLWNQIRPKWPEVNLKLQANVPLSVTLDNVLISGVGTPVGQKLLSMMVSNPPKKLVLIDSSESHVAFMQAWMKKFMPTTQVVYALSASLSATELKSLFKTYGIKYVFDVDRSYTFSHMDGAQQNFLSRNLTFPRVLIDQAVSSKVKYVVSLSAIPLYADEALETAQSVLECYAQRLDSEKTRVIVLRHRAPAEGADILPNLMSQFWGYDKSNLLLSPTDEVAKTILTVLTQLQQNPSHYGAVWALTHVCEFKKMKLQREIQPSDNLDEIASKIKRSIKGIKLKIQDSDNLFPTSQDGAAIVADCPIIETDFDQCFRDVEELLRTHPAQGQKKKA